MEWTFSLWGFPPNIMCLYWFMKFGRQVISSREQMRMNTTQMRWSSNCIYQHMCLLYNIYIYTYIYCILYICICMYRLCHRDWKAINQQGQHDSMLDPLGCHTFRPFRIQTDTRIMSHWGMANGWTSPKWINGWQFVGTHNWTLDDFFMTRLDYQKTDHSGWGKSIDGATFGTWQNMQNHRFRPGKFLVAQDSVSPVRRYG